MRGFLEGAPFLLTGPERWNALGLGATAVFPVRLVYNTKRSGEFRLGGRRFLLRRVRFPRKPAPEWFAVDLIERHEMTGLSLDELEENLSLALLGGRLELQKLREASRDFGTRSTEALIERAAERAADLI